MTIALFRGNDSPRNFLLTRRVRASRGKTNARRRRHAVLPRAEEPMQPIRAKMRIVRVDRKCLSCKQMRCDSRDTTQLAKATRKPRRKRISSEKKCVERLRSKQFVEGIADRAE
jgi:hypothetical protein